MLVAGDLVQIVLAVDAFSGEEGAAGTRGFLEVGEALAWLDEEAAIAGEVAFAEEVEVVALHFFEDLASVRGIAAVAEGDFVYFRSRCEGFES